MSAQPIIVGFPPPDYIVERFVNFLKQEDEKLCRPPWQEAKVLAYYVELHKEGRKFPVRKQVAEFLDVSVPTVDRIRSIGLSLGYITERFIYVDGNVKQRPSAKQERYIIPSQILIDVYDGRA